MRTERHDPDGEDPTSGPSRDETATRGRPRGRGRRAKAAVAALAVAVAAALLHMVPYWHAERSTPDGWRFTGNLHSSPDFMQYRLWMRQTSSEGAIVDNRFTGEPHRPYLPVVFYRFVGGLARAVGAEPEWTSVVLGAGLAIVLVLALVAITGSFVGDLRRRWWILGAMLVGGGLGAHLKLAKMLVLAWLSGGGSAAAAIPPVAAGPSRSQIFWLLVEDLRGHYLFSTLFDTHFLMIWLAMLAALVAFYRALDEPTALRSVSAALLFAGATWLHLYEAVTLVVIVWACLALWWAKGRLRRRAIVDGVACSLAALGVLGYFLWLQLRSGLPLPGWVAAPMPLSIVLIAHPVAWALILWGIHRYWAAAGPRELFLLGWALGCTLVTQAGPFYPYPDRGAMTLQVPLYLVAGTIYFRRWRTVTVPAFALAVALLGVTPVWIFRTMWRAGQFSPDAPHKWLSADERATLDALHRKAGSSDLLLEDPEQAIWLAPEHPGRHYVAHFFLTVGFESKRLEWETFCAGPRTDRLAFLDERGIRFVHLPSQCDPNTADESAGLLRLNEDRMGVLYERIRPASAAATTSAEPRAVDRALGP